LLAKAGSVEGLADRVVAVLKDDGLRKELSRNALDYSKRFSWDKTAEAFMKVLKRTYNEG